MPEDHADPEVDEAVDDQLEPRVVDHAAALDEAAAEHAVVALLELLPVPHHVAAVVALVGHHDDRRVAGHRVEPLGDRASEAVQPLVLHWHKLGNLLALPLQDVPCGVCRAVIDHHDLMRHALELQLHVQMVDRGGDAALLVTGGNHHTQLGQRLGVTHRWTPRSPRGCRQSG